MKIKKNLTLISLMLSVMMIVGMSGMVSAISPISVSYGTVGTGATATQVGTNVKLYTANGGDGSAYVRLNIPGGISLNTISSLSYTAKVTDTGTGGFAPEVILNIDADGDGLEGTGLAWMTPATSHSPSALGDDNFLSGDNWPVNAGSVDSSFVTRDALYDYAYWSANNARDAFGSLYNSFTTIVPGLLPIHGIDATDKVYSIDFVVGTSSNFDDMEVLFKSITLNGVTYDVVLPCTVTVTQPTSGWYGYENIDMTWSYSGDCDISTQLIQRQDSIGRKDIRYMGNNEDRTTTWFTSDPWYTEGQFSLCVYAGLVDQTNKLGCSARFNIDLTAPTVEANGPYICDEGNPVTLVSTGTSDSGSGIASYEWKVNNVVVSTGSSYTYNCLDGYNQYPVLLTVIDVVGNSETDDSTVTINNVAPWNVDAHGSGYFGTEGISISFTGSATDVPADILSWLWTFGDGGTSTLQNPTHTYMDNGTYVVTLTVSDEDGGSTTVSTTAEIGDLGPTANAGIDQTIDEGQTVTVSGSGSTSSPDSIVKYEWDWTTDGIYDTEGVGATSPAYMDNGTYTITLRVTDEDGSTSTDTLTLTVNDLGPTAHLTGDTNLDEGVLGNWDASSSTSSPDAIVSYEWDWNYDGSFDAGDTGVTQTHTYNQDGSYRVAVRVTDEDGSKSIAELTITIDNFAPVITNLPIIKNAIKGELFTFDVEATDASPSDTLVYSLVSTSGMMIDSSTGIVSWTPTALGAYTANVSVYDGTDTVYGILTVNVYKYKIELTQGWNLISIPLVPENDNTSIAFVFDQIDQNIDKVWSYTYDATSGKNVWKYNELNEVGWMSGDSHVQNIIPGYGYYVYMNVEGTIYLNGEEFYGVGSSPSIPMPPTVTLAMDSWNLIGTYGLHELDKTFALKSLTDEENHPYYDVIYNENGFTPFLLRSAEGYWLSVKKVFAGKDTVEYKANYLTFA